MLGMRGFYITKAEYDSIRKNLVSNNNQLIKIALQNLITKLEYGQRMNNVCSKDLCAVLYDVVQNDDYKIRKWAYHLIVYKQNRALVNRCIHNLKSGFEKDAENILNKFSKTLENIPDLEETWYITDNLNLTREDKSHEKHPEKILRNAHIDKEGKLVVKRADWVN